MADLPQPNGAFAWVQAVSGQAACNEAAERLAGPGAPPDDRRGLPALVCRPLAALAPHVFTTRGWSLGSRTPGRDEPAWAEVAGVLHVPPADLIHPRQVHGATVLVARDDAETPLAGAAADIIVTDRSGIGLAVQAADCVPLLIADRRTGAVAAAHAGWRGLAARVPSAAVAALLREYGSAPGDLVAAVGPSVGACCYEVDVDVRQAFEAAGFAADRLAGWFSDEPLVSTRNPAMPGLAGRRRAGRWFFDGWVSVRDQLIDAGVGSDAVFVSELCTASHPATFCSYRRDGPRPGRQAGAIRRPGW